MAFLDIKSIFFGLKSAISSKKSPLLDPKSTLPGLYLNLFCLKFSITSQTSNLSRRMDVRKFTPVSYRTSSPWGRCPALAPLLKLIFQVGNWVPLTMSNSLMTCYFLYIFAVSGLTTFAQDAMMTSNTALVHPHTTVVAV